MTIRELREENNVSTKLLSKKLKITIQALHLKETGMRKFTAIEIQKICEFFDVSINELDLNPNNSNFNNLDIRKK